MKKLILFTLLSVALMGCARDYLGKEDVIKTNLPSTRVFVQGHLVDGPMTKSGLVWPYVSPDGWETARFSLRADNTAPDYMDHPSTLYYGRPPGKDGNNRGKVYTDFPYGHYNDRDFDYEKVDKKTGNNIGLFRYVFDRKGIQTQLAIMEAPTVRAILGDEVVDLQKAIDAGKDVAKNQACLDDVNALLAKSDEYLQSHILWYVVKEVGMKNGWHVNGVVADYEVPIPDPHMVADNVEVDIHQQVHKDWAEIKTSVHVRTDAQSVVINIPLAYEDILEGDGVNVRVFKDHFNGTQYEGLSVTITHDQKGITIAIDGINAAKIEEYKESFGDGLTVEIESPCANDDAARIWNAVKNSSVVTTGKPCTVVGQITSAQFEGSYAVRVTNPPKVQ